METAPSPVESKAPVAPATPPANQVPQTGVAKGLVKPTPPTIPVGTDAASRAVLAGGNKGGRQRDDGLVPGSEAAAAADRKKDRERKARDRELVAKANPAALPSRAVETLGPVPPLVGGSPGLPLDGIAETPPWTAEMVSPGCLQALLLLEELDKAFMQAKLGQANIPPELWKGMLDELRWPEVAKKGLTKDGAEAVAKLFTAMGVHPKYAYLINVFPSAIYLVLDRVKAHKRLTEIITVANAATTQPGQSQKKP